MSGAARRIAAIDIGTVTTRLLVADVAENSVAELYRSTDITHLGEGLADTGRLSRVAMDRVADVLAGYLDAIGEYGASQVSAVATSASRDAENAEEFLGRLESVGVVPRIIAGDTEARLSFLGATHGLEGSGLLVDDIGGGSTELIVGDVSAGVRTLRHARSIDVGSRRITARFLCDDPPTPRQLAEAREHVSDRLGAFLDPIAGEVRTVVSVAGTATSLVSMDLALDTYDSRLVHGFRLSHAAIGERLAAMARMTVAERREIVGLHPGRAGVIVAGALILDVLLDLVGKDSTVVSEHDILYGILLDTYGNTDG